MVSEDGTTTTKEMNLQDVRFSRGNTLSVNDFETNITTNTLAAYPNPMVNASSIQFTSNKTETVELVIYNQLGKTVFNKIVKTQVGKNKIALQKQNLSSGLYICKLSGTQTLYNPLKLLVK